MTELRTPIIETQPTRKSADERKEALARIITAQVANGARLESQSDYQAVLVQGHRLNNTLHRILTSVDECGNVSIQKALVLPVAPELHTGAAAKTANERRSALARQVAILVARGRHIESQGDYQAVLVTGRYLWVWREIATVDALGNVSVQKLGVDKERLYLAFAVVAVIVILLGLSALLG